MKRILILLTGYSIAMALLEAAVVVYMRQLYYPQNPLKLFPLRFLQDYDPILELSREVATVVMILTVALLAERKTLTRSFAAFVYLFGVWDLFYYVWLKALIDWPRTWLEWDVLFLIPMVWLGPWICPAIISLLFIFWGGWVLASSCESTPRKSTPRDVRFTGRSLFVFSLGAALGLLSFMQPVLSQGALLENGSKALASYMPGEFWWWLYGISYVLMTGGLVMTTRNQHQETTDQSCKV